MLREEGEAPVPGEFRRFRVVARAAGIVVEGVVHAFIHVELVGLVVGLQRRLIGGNARIDPLILRA